MSIRTLILRVRRRAACAGLVALAFSPLAQADGDRRESRVPPLPAYQQECAACHVAYPPALLPAASWQRLMGRLATHYGTDASLDPATTKALADWLAAHGGSGKRAREEPPDDRITRSAWFIRKHDEVPAEAWKRASIKSASNCGACHTGANQGDFDEDRVRIPR